jgi:hypothetical protein
LTKANEPRSSVRRWLAAERAGQYTVEASIQAVVRVHATLTHHLSRVLGDDGVNVLSSRAIRVVCAEHAFLRTLDVRVTDLAEPLRMCVERTELVHEMAENLLTVFVEVLISILGENLTWRLLGDLAPSHDVAEPEK